MIFHTFSFYFLEFSLHIDFSFYLAQKLKKNDVSHYFSRLVGTFHHTASNIWGLHHFLKSEQKKLFTKN